MAPGVDYVTSSAVGPFIDTGRNIVDQAGRILGRLYLSKDTVAEMAQELGLLSTHADQTSIQAAYAKGKLDGLKEELAQAKEEARPMRGLTPAQKRDVETYIAKKFRTEGEHKKP